MRKTPRFSVLVLFVLVSLVTSSCGPEKARALVSAAVQFRNESLTAIDAIETLLAKETEAPQRSAEEVDQEFVRSILQLPPERIDENAIQLALDPYTADLKGANDKRNELLASLRLQYSKFASIFDDLEAGSYFAKDAVEKTKEPARKLTAQMASFASVISKNPPKLLQYRTAITAEIKRLRESPEIATTATDPRASGLLTNDPPSSEAALPRPDTMVTRTDATDTASPEVRQRLIDLKNRWLEMEAEEKELQRATVAQCLKAVSLGLELSKLIENYRKISLNDLNAAVARAFDVAGQFMGRDLTSLKNDTSALFERVNGDPDLRALAEAALEEINSARAGS